MLLAGVQNLLILPPKSGDFGLRFQQLFSSPTKPIFLERILRFSFIRNQYKQISHFWRNGAWSAAVGIHKDPIRLAAHQ